MVLMLSSLQVRVKLNPQVRVKLNLQVRVKPNLKSGLHYSSRTETKVTESLSPSPMVGTRAAMNLPNSRLKVFSSIFKEF